MKRKVGTLIEDEVMRLAKRRAAEEGRPMSDVIQDALIRYLHAGAAHPKEREAAYNLFCNNPFKLTPKQFRQVLEEDAWDV